MRPRPVLLAAVAIAAAVPVLPGRAAAAGFLIPGLDAWRAEGLRVTLAAAGAGLLLADALLARCGRGQAHRRLRGALLAILAILGGLSWWGFGGLHFTGVYIHGPDMYHYYLGAKYVREMGHTRLYECTVVAEAEDGLGVVARDRKIRDLDTNLLRGTHAVLADPGRCTRHFTPERWASFRRDVAWFRARTPPLLWAMMLRDHGYNGTPAWAVLGTALANAAPASTATLLLLALIDPVLLVAMWALVAATFGWRATCVALVYWGTNNPASFAWTGGSFLRQDWLALSVAGICLLKRDRPTLAGVAFTWAALLRIFPALIVGGLVVKAVVAMVRARRPILSIEHRRFALGCLISLALIVPASVAVAGWDAWPRFLDNTRKHVGTPLTNYMGLKTVVAFEHETRVSETVPLELDEDTFKVWKDARHRVFAERWWVFAAAVTAFVLILARAVERHPDWVAAVLGVGLIVVAVELTCYYYSILLAYGLLGDRRPLLGAGLCALAAAGGVIALRLPLWDVRYTAISALCVLFVFAATAGLSRRPIPRAARATADVSDAA